MAVSGEITKGFEPFRHVYGGSTPTLELTAGGAIPSIGVVLVQSAGKVVVQTGAVTTVDVVGVAANTASADGDTVLVWPAWPGLIFTAQFEDQSAGDSTPHTIVQDNLLNTYGVYADPGGSLYEFIDENDTNDGTKVVATLGLAPGSAIGDTLARLQCVFVSAGPVWGGGTVKAHS